MSSVAEKIIKQKLAENTVSVLLLRGEDKDGDDSFAYFAIRLDIMDDFKKAYSKGDVNLEEYGFVILSSKGEPTEAQKTFMEKEFGFNHKDAIVVKSDKK